MAGQNTAGLRAAPQPRCNALLCWLMSVGTRLVLCMVTDFCIGFFVIKIHTIPIGKGVIKETWIAKIKEIGCWTEELITFCPFSPVSAWSKKLPNFAVKHVDLSWDFGHDVPCYIQHCMDLQLAVDPFKRHGLFESMDWLPKTYRVIWHISANQISTKCSLRWWYDMRSEDCNFHRNQTFGRRTDHLFVNFWTSEIGHFDS